MKPGLPINAYVAQRLLTGLSNAGPQSILPIELAVIAGRSYKAWERGKFLEFQERLPEEVAVAAVWLYGVKYMARIMENVVGRMQQQGKLPASLNTKADWSKSFMTLFMPGKSKPAIQLSPMERFTTSYANLTKTYGVKGAMWGTAVAVPLILCGWVIPKLNQAKTNWILRTFYNGKNPLHSETPAQSAAQDNSASGKLPGATNAASPGEASPWTGGNQAAPNYPGAMAAAPRFGMTGKGLASLGNVAHMVDNTHYGQILVVDAGITGGRMVSAWPRSKYESFEYGMRDATSLFFYLWSVPMMMKGADKLLNLPGFSRFTSKLPGRGDKTIVSLDQQVISKINERLMRELGTKPVTPEALRALLQGTAHPALAQADTVLRPQLRQVAMKPFMSLLETELAAYATSPEEAQVARNVLDGVKQTLKNKATVSADDLEGLLKAIWNKAGAFEGLSDGERFHLQTAAKLSFHHQAGVTAKTLEKTVLGTVGHQLDAAEKAALKGRLSNAATLGGDNVLASALRRSLNAANLAMAAEKTSAQTAKWLQQAETVAQCAERAVLDGTPIERFAQSHLENVLAEYRQYLQSLGKKGKANPRTRQLTSIVRQVEGALSQNKPISAATLEKLANLLETNGRTGPKGLMWLQGPGLKHLANDVRAVVPLVDGKTPAAQVLTAQIEQTMGHLSQMTAGNPNQQALIRQYQQMVGSLIRGEGRFNVMLTRSNPKFATLYHRQMKALLQGGLQHGDDLYAKALGTLEGSASMTKGVPSAEKLQKVSGLVDRYLALVEKQVRFEAQAGALSPEALKKTLGGLAKNNAKWRYGAWGVALGISMWGVGLLIPKLQYLMTKTLTGQDTPPGIAAASDRLKKPA